MSNIPKARNKLFELAKVVETGGRNPKEIASSLRQVALHDLVRRSPARRMEKKSKPITPEIKAKIIELAETTELHSSEIAAQLGVNPGRVSEILQGDK